MNKTFNQLDNVISNLHICTLNIYREIFDLQFSKEPSCGIHIITPAHMYTHSDTHTHIHANAHTHTHARAHTHHTHTHTRTHTHHTHTHTHTHAHTHTSHTHTHTHAHTHTCAYQLSEQKKPDVPAYFG